MTMRKFDITRDIAVIEAGGFLCRGCLAGKAASEQSDRDVRYCTFCQPLIEADYALSADRQGKPLTTLYKPIRAPQETTTKVPEAPFALVGTQSTTPAPPVFLAPKKTTRRRGRPGLVSVPEDRIRRMGNQGLGAKRIAVALQREGFQMSIRTVARILAGQREPSPQLTLPMGEEAPQCM